MSGKAWSRSWKSARRNSRTRFHLICPTITRGGTSGSISDGEAVIPGREANPGSRDSGSGPSDHPGMTDREMTDVQDCVVLLHGISRTALSFRKMQTALEA